MAGWYAVTDMKPLKGGKWQTVANPMLGVRFCEMQDRTGYLAVRYATARYIYGDGVPQHIYHVLRKHRGASIYLRQQVVGKYPCVEIVKYETPEAYQADQGPVREKLAAMARKRLENVHSPEMTLFGPVIPGSHPKRREKRLIGGWISEGGA
jgi:hypothetical protein